MFHRNKNTNDPSLYECLVQRRPLVARNKALTGTNNSANTAVATPAFPSAISSPIVDEALSFTHTTTTTTSRAISDHPSLPYQFIVNDAIAVVDHDEETTHRKVCRSSCDPDENPDVARNLIWHDPFYENPFYENDSSISGI